MHLVIGGCVLQASCCDYIIIIFRFGVWAGGGRARSLWGSGLRPSLGRAGGRRGGAGRPFQRSSPIENTPMLGGFGGGALPARSIANTTRGVTQWFPVIVGDRCSGKRPVSS